MARFKRQAFIRFAALSGTGWLIDLTLLIMLSAMGVQIGVANVVSSATAAMTVFFVSRVLVFAPAEGRVGARASLYLAYQVFNIALVSLLIGFVAEAVAWLGRAAGWQIVLSQQVFWAKALVTPPQLMANFFVSRFLIQRSLAPRGAHLPH